MINSDVSSIIDWTAGNNLKLNASKTTAMIVGTARYINMLYLDTLPRIIVESRVRIFLTGIMGYSIKYLVRGTSRLLGRLLEYMPHCIN